MQPLNSSHTLILTWNSSIKGHVPALEPFSFCLTSPHSSPSNVFALSNHCYFSIAAAFRDELVLGYHLTPISPPPSPQPPAQDSASAGDTGPGGGPSRQYEAHRLALTLPSRCLHSASAVLIGPSCVLVVGLLSDPVCPYETFLDRLVFIQGKLLPLECVMTSLQASSLFLMPFSFATTADPGKPGARPG